MNITADTVKQLRERTGAGMMECKKALVETKGDLDAAAELMRKSGLAKADKKAARIAAEGTVVAERAGNSAVLMEVNCETDFVARSAEFQEFARDLAKAALTHVPADVQVLLQLKHGSGTLEDRRRALIAKIGENIAVRRVRARRRARGARVPTSTASRIGSLVALEGGDEALARGSRHARAGGKPRLHRCARGARRGAREGTRDPDRSDQGREKAAGDHRQDGRGAAAQVPGGDHAARPALRQGSGNRRSRSCVKKAGARVVRIRALRGRAGIEKKQDDFVGEVMAQVKAQDKAEQGVSDELAEPSTGADPIIAAQGPRARGVFYSRVLQS